MIEDSRPELLTNYESFCPSIQTPLVYRFTVQYSVNLQYLYEYMYERAVSL